MEAETARLEPTGWILTGVKEWSLTDPNPELSARQDEGPVTLASDLTAERIRDSFGSPSTIAFWDLPDYIGDLERAGFSSQA
ncbi:MAG TPA: LPS export ABC transporter permease LptG, partial [Tabrizicola sp.]|nr:LPS export ABC transporter permease LptG [Tabrizicola sp.]